MKIISEKPFSRFQAWSGAIETQERIIEENKEDLFEQTIEELYPDGLTDTELNDLLWFDSEQVFEWLGITDEESEDETDTEELADRKENPADWIK